MNAAGATEVPPVLLLGFRRPHLLSQVIEQIRIARPPRVYLSVDGPRLGNRDDENCCAATRELVEVLDWDCSISTLFRPSNLGSARAVSEGISWFFDHEAFGVILEEDCLPDPTFFEFAGALDARYRHEQSVGMVAGFAPLRRSYARASSYVFTSQPLTWGWATWRRAWKSFDLLDASWDDMEAADLLRRTFAGDERAVEFWTRRISEAASQRVDAWDYQWFLALLKAQQLCATPLKAMVQNIGFGKGASNTTRERRWVEHLRSAPMQRPLVHPQLRVDREVQQDLNRDFYRVRRYTSSWYKMYERMISPQRRIGPSIAT